MVSDLEKECDAFETSGSTYPGTQLRNLKLDGCENMLSMTGARVAQSVM